MKKVICAMILIGCSAETTTVSVNSGGVNSGGENTAGINNGGNNSGGVNVGGGNSGGVNVGGVNNGGVNTGGSNSGKPDEFQALFWYGATQFCAKYKNKGLTLGNYLDTEYIIYSFDGAGVKKPDGTCENQLDNKWVSFQEEIINNSFFNDANVICHGNDYPNQIPIAKCINWLHNNQLNIFNSDTFLIERSKIPQEYLDMTYRLFDPSWQNDKIVDIMKPIREYFIEQYVTGKTCE